MHLSYCNIFEQMGAFQFLKQKWLQTKTQLGSFITIFYAWGSYEAKSLKATYLWSLKWGHNFFSQNNNFIENSQHYFKPDAYIIIDKKLLPTKARCWFTQYGKPHTFWIKFWWAAVLNNKYLINTFPYLGKTKHLRNAYVLVSSNLDNHT